MLCWEVVSIMEQKRKGRGIGNIEREDREWQFQIEWLGKSTEKAFKQRPDPGEQSYAFWGARSIQQVQGP